MQNGSGALLIAAEGPLASQDDVITYDSNGNEVTYAGYDLRCDQLQSLATVRVCQWNSGMRAVPPRRQHTCCTGVSSIAVEIASVLRHALTC